ncbi:hypothetical protein [Burkholderia sola]|uniref:hypothetical protein n=1 Tax=Burkholderia sola TaxID=2843302 RepID=UPI001C0A8ECD|nr:hypothetical protein BCCR75389_01272 [Burkholderia cenocepacia]CAG2266758.1 hypothetical protein BCCR75386_01287 [Burkholderia cenocepacia]CAG2266937.1 hypothetical protein BCCR75388_01288 [Burkholderia cenocepacia]CAG2267129.1 hypothetical protein BCCR75384_01287 [Burkholderia cenocepacia]CAG2267174.1 hypothetical protein BCCR75387_01287 [Burkholderia cenocepacia]
MNLENDVSSIIEKVNSGEFDSLSDQLDSGDFGIFYPAYVEDGTVKMMKPGYSQTETNLKIAVTSTGLKDPDAKTIAWMGGGATSWSSCNHPGTGPHSCKHQNGHGDCIHCRGHASQKSLGDGSTEGLDYFNAVNKLDNKQDLLNSLAPHGLGLTLLHAHSDEYEFTKLPVNMVSVIANGVTSFRKIEDVAKDETFVPNAWRFISGKLEIAGGFSQQSE